MTSLIQQLVNALSLAGIYALVGVGISLVFGMSGVINFAQADLLMVGAFVTVTIAGSTGSFVLGCVGAVVALAAFGVVAERVLFRPVSGRPINGFIISVGLIAVLENGAEYIWGPSSRTLNAPVNGVTNVGGVQVLNSHLLLLLVTVAIVTLLFIVLYRTSIGLQVRAAVLDRDAATLMGINVTRINAYVFVTASVLAGLGGCLSLLVFPVSPFIGATLIVQGFVAALLGGLEKPQGVLWGALLIGVLESFSFQFNIGQWSTLVEFCAVILVILIRPEGLVGSSQPA